MAKLKQKPNGIYYLDVMVPGPEGNLVRSRVSCDTRDELAAKAQLRDWLAGLHPKHPSRGAIVAPKGRTPVRDASTSATVSGSDVTVHVFLTQLLSDPNYWGGMRAFRNHQSAVRILSDLIPADKLLRDVSSEYVLELQNRMFTERNYKAGSVKKLRGYLSKALRIAHGRGLIPAMPTFEKITKSPPRSRVLTFDEEAVLLDCIRARALAEPLKPWWHFERLIIVLLDTGFRLGEALYCGPGRVDRRRWKDERRRWHEGLWLSLTRDMTKNGLARSVPLTKRLQRLVPELNQRQVAGRWFPWSHGSSMPITMLDKLREDMKLRGYPIDDVVLHTMRHTCATRLASNGMDLLGLSKWMGHKDIKVTHDTYIHLMQGHIYWGASILDELVSPPDLDEEGNDDPDLSKCDILDVQECGRDRAVLGTLGLH